ncbi:putative Urocanate hydratase [Paratrimastix pyriformis]|uniref:urocanate hydratase n=1 Tax=Paratrimastix pyriformis TaxID=342808 RepID=A0ABQ8UQS3_9EUKA|nr:putative Urocanate hydratase [Paratrimastix pyriformis]
MASEIDLQTWQRAVAGGIPSELPQHPGITSGIPHAPKRNHQLQPAEKRLALENALRYIPAMWHETLAKEFLAELENDGHIYMRRFRPTYRMYAHPLEHYPCRCKQAGVIMLMIQNNLDPAVAQFPEELVTNWVQYLLVMHYLSEMTDHQTLVMYSGHPLGLFPSHPDAPRVCITNGMMIPNYSSKTNYDRMYALGVTQYGQMTAGSYAYIGPQGIVHGTTLTVLNAARKYLGTQGPTIPGRVYLSAGLGGMSGAQAKAGTILQGISVIAEINEAALMKRHRQGWVTDVARDLPTVDRLVREARAQQRSLSVGYLGNVVDLWEHYAQLAERGEHVVDLASDQTSLHNPYGGGYYPVGLSFDEANRMMVENPALFKEKVQESLRRQVRAINTCCQHGVRFWDYGNAFLLEASRAGAEIMNPTGSGFRYPTYFEEFMGDIFSMGFGPFRWVCTSGLESDLLETDRIAAEVLTSLMEEARRAAHLEADFRTRLIQQYQDNLHWIQQAHANRMVVGSQARILYSDERGRMAIGLAFNQAIKEGRLTAPVALSRDHHDVSGTDSPYRETSNIKDGSQFTADMAVQTFLGNGFRGATWVSLHNGGGVGWGEVMNGGFGLVVDGTDDAARRAAAMLSWDVNNGVARRAWSKNECARYAIARAMDADPNLRVTLGEKVAANVLDALHL